MRPRKALKGEKPAMGAGLTDRVWSIAEIAALVEAEDVPAKKRGPYRAPPAEVPR